MKAVQKLTKSIEYFLFEEKRNRNALLFIAAVTSFIVPLTNFFSNTIRMDWDYFNGLSHFVRSSILHYHTLPLQDPWTCGGIDVLANPQSRFFSPFVIYDLIFTAPLANLFSLMTLGLLGVFGFYRLLKFLKMDNMIAVIGAVIFIHASWFSLHFSEGHITFGSFQLMGWAIYFILRIQEAKFKLYYMLLCAFFILEGSMYMFIFANILLACALILGMGELRLRFFFKSIVSQWKSCILAVIIFGLLASAKVVPVLLLHGTREPIQEFVQLKLKTIAVAFFDPIQYLYKKIPGTELQIRFHEIGTYIGIILTAIALYALFYTSKRKKLFPWLILSIFFFWTGSGLFQTVNPYQLFQEIPLINNAHIQSRFWIITYVAILIISCYGLSLLKNKLGSTAFMILSLILVIEAVFVSSVPWVKVYAKKDMYTATDVFDKLIESDNLDKTINYPINRWEYKCYHYFVKNEAAKYAVEPAHNRGNIKSITDTDYRGEIYTLDGVGDVELVEYTPGYIRLVYSGCTAPIQINTNYLYGWKSEQVDQCYSDQGLLTFLPQINENPERQEVELYYTREYLYFILPLFVLGLVLSIIGLLLASKYERNKIKF